MVGFGNSASKNHQFSKVEIVNRALRFHSEGKVIEAEKLYKFYIDQGYKDRTIFNNYAVICKNSGRLEESIRVYKKSIELFVDNPDAYANLALIFKDSGQTEEAIAFTKKAVSLKPDNPVFNYNLGNLLHDIGINDQAEYYLRLAIKLNPNFISAYNNLGCIFLALGRLVEAKSNFNKVISLNPSFSTAYTNLGVVLRDLGDYQGAISNFIKSIEIDNTSYKSYYYLSTLYESQASTNKWVDLLFTLNLDCLNPKDLIDIYFAKANIYHRNLKFHESSEMLIKANNLNATIYPSDYQTTVDNINKYSRIWPNTRFISSNDINYNPAPIFIVGLPRSGKTIVESILTCNQSLIPVGESEVFSDAIDIFLSEKNTKSLHELYINKLGLNSTNASYVSNTNPINYIYSGLILTHLKESRIIYCYRNILDNIYELYSKNLSEKYTFKNSILESIKISFKIKSLMNSYNSTFKDRIYFLDYDQLVLEPNTQINSLISWLGWKEDQKYLKPLLHPSTNTKLNRIDSNLNCNHQNKWVNYRKLLQPAIDYLNSN